MMYKDDQTSDSRKGQNCQQQLPLNATKCQQTKQLDAYVSIRNLIKYTKIQN